MNSPAQLRPMSQTRPTVEASTAATVNATQPWRHLGALACLFFWLILGSGAYLYVQLDTSVSGVYDSIGRLSREQPWFGGLLRSLHRYAADTFLLLSLLHLLRELLLGRWNSFRRYAWLTGLPLLAFIYISDIAGFWLRWDQLAHFSALATAEWLDGLGIFATPLTRNFLTTAAVSDRLFSLLIFMHIGIALLLLFALWFHLRRYTRADVFPTRALTLGSLASLALLALLRPVTSAAAADLGTVPQALALDWFYLFFHALMPLLSATGLWSLLAVVTLTLLLVPYSMRAGERRSSPRHG